MFEICLCEQLAKTVERNSESDVQVNLNLLEAFIFSRVEVVFYTDRLLFQSFFFFLVWFLMHLQTAGHQRCSFITHLLP